MSEDYRKMWEDLGLDLAAHDALLGVLGQGYQDIYMAQKNRPEGMKYFDFVMSEVHGLRVKALQDEKAKGRKVIGSFCVFVPEEIVRAADATLVGLCTGAAFATEEVEMLLPRNTCSGRSRSTACAPCLPNRKSLPWWPRAKTGGTSRWPSTVPWCVGP